MKLINRDEQGKSNKVSKGNEYGAVATILGPETYLDGTLKFKKSLKIEGEFRGKIKTEGLLIIGENANVEANVRVGALVLGGALKGDVEASEKIEMLSTGKLIGNIKTPLLKIESGVLFEGQCIMSKGEVHGDKKKGEKEQAPPPQEKT